LSFEGQCIDSSWQNVVLDMCCQSGLGFADWVCHIGTLMPCAEAVA